MMKQTPHSKHDHHQKQYHHPPPPPHHQQQNHDVGMSNGDGGGSSSSGSHIIKINVSHGPIQHQMSVPAQSTFGDLKEVVAKETGLEPKEQKILFRGKEKDDDEQLHTAGVKDKSKVLVLEQPESKEAKLQDAKKSENVNQTEDTKLSEETLKALEKIAGVRSEVDKLSEKVSALKLAVDGGTKVSDREFDIPTELLMRELLKLDGIEAEGEARLQRRAEVRRVQEFQEMLDKLKARNSPFGDCNKDTSVTANWETFDSGMGSLSVPHPVSSSTKVTHDWEQFD